MRHASALGVSAQQGWISFETAAHCRELEHHFSANDLQASVRVLFLKTLETHIL